MRNIDYIIIHCSATKAKPYIDADVIRRWHVEENGWSDIGYQGVIKTDGTYEPGRSLAEAGAHAKGYNKRSIGICLVGGLDDLGRPADTFTAAQMDTLAKVVDGLRIVLDVPDENIVGHRDLPGVAKACPCTDVRAWWERVR